MTAALRLAWVVLVLMPGVAGALDLEVPGGARMTVERATDVDSYDAPLAGFVDGAVRSATVEGSVVRRAWRIDTGGLTPLQVMAPLRAQIAALGYDVVFDCDSRSCGGFDFRFAIEVLPGPNMYVNIGSYRHLTALKGLPDAPREAVTVLASVTAASAYVQVIHAQTGPLVTAPPDVPEPADPEPRDATDPQGPFDVSALLETGAMVLQDLDFDTGTTALSAGPYGSLNALAEFLQDRPELRVALVGHTDTVGGLAPNISLSRARAQSVRDRLVTRYGINAGRLDAEGMGYLAPIASNLTPEGRDANRRVEAILLSTQ